MPCRSCQALNGESDGPNVRIVSIRQRMMKPKSPKVSWKITP